MATKLYRVEFAGFVIVAAENSEDAERIAMDGIELLYEDDDYAEDNPERVVETETTLVKDAKDIGGWENSIPFHDGKLEEALPTCGEIIEDAAGNKGAGRKRRRRSRGD